MTFTAMKIRALLQSSAIVLIAMIVVLPAYALPVLDRAPNLRPTLPDDRGARTESFSSERAVAIAERRYNGKVVGARHLGNGLYRVRVLQDNGKVKTVTVRPD